MSISFLQPTKDSKTIETKINRLGTRAGYIN